MNIILTLTTIPSRLSDSSDYGIKSCIESLLNQNYNEYEIHINIPGRSKQTGEEYIIPEWLKEISNDKLKIFSDLEDLGPVTKIYYTLQRITNPESIIIVCDDDLVYHPDMIKEHIKNQSEQDCVFGYDALGSYESKFGDIRDHYVVSVPFEVRGKVLQHYKTVSYKRKYFNDDFFNFVTEYYSWSDDILLSAYMQKNKITRLVMPYEEEEKFESLEQWQAKGGVLTFPVIKHTFHNSYEGCNIFRQNKIEDNSSQLYKFIDN